MANNSAPDGQNPLHVVGKGERTQRGSRVGYQRVAAVIPAKDEGERIAATVRAARAIPYLDLVVVVDDGSQDDTAHQARNVGAVVVRHSVNRGKASGMETGAAVVGMRDRHGFPPRLLLFLDADLGASAVNAAPLIPPVITGKADLSIAALPPQEGAGGRGIVTGFSRRSIKKQTGWAPSQPLSGQRCITREAFDAAQPLASGWGVETGMTIDVLNQGFAVVEVPCDLHHRPTQDDLAGYLHRFHQLRGVMAAVAKRRFRRYDITASRVEDTE